MSSIYLEKYSKTAIESALQSWTNYGEPEIQSIISKLENPLQNDTHFILIKHRPIFKNNLLLLRHWFVSINDLEWHPGNPKTDIFIPKKDESQLKFLEYNNDGDDTKIVEIREYCNFCVNNFFRAKFAKDCYFNIFWANCECILDYFWETLIIWIAFLLLLIFILTRAILFIILTICAIFSIGLLNCAHNQVTLTFCPHINKI